MYQKTILIGRIGKNEFGVTPNTQTSVANYSIATTKSIKDKETGKWNEKTQWHNCVSFNKCAEHIGENIKPGDLIQVEGELETQKWQDNDGNDRYTTKLVVNDFPKKLPRYFNRDGQAASQQSQPEPMAQAAGQDFNSDPSYQSFDDDIPL